MGRLSRFFGNPGSRPDIHRRAPIVTCDDLPSPLPSKVECTEVEEVVSSSDVSLGPGLCDISISKSGEIRTSSSFTGLEKGLVDSILDWLVMAAGSQFVFICMWVLLIVWTVIGIVFSAPFNWQVVMQDGQSIQSYFWDTLLMRQQLMSAHEQALTCGTLRSRIGTYKRLFGLAKPKVERGVDLDVFKGERLPVSSLPEETWYDKLSTVAGTVIGSVYSMIAFWLCIIIWIACGVVPSSSGNDPPFTGETSGSNPRLQRFSGTWQMYINTATAVALLICTVFLQNIRSRHDKFLSRFLVDIFDMDEKIERRLRCHFNDFETPNPVITIHSRKRGLGEKFIDWYADIIGTGVGVFITTVVFAVWLGTGHIMKWDDTWWLIIGTYTGLIGFFDGFVLRQVYFRVVHQEEGNYAALAQEDYELFQMIGIECTSELFGEVEEEKSIQYKISAFINRVCSSQVSVFLSIGIIIALLSIATGLRWSITGQLIANSPTMIIETFFLIVLIQAHNWADQKRRAETSALFARRCLLLSYVESRYFCEQVDVND